MDVDGELQCLPMEIIPKGLSMQDYELKFNKNERRINEVNHREFGPVEFDG